MADSAATRQNATTMGQSEFVQTLGGHVAALLVIVQAIVAKHPNRAELAKELRELAESDIAVVLAMSAPGMPKFDASFRTIMEQMAASAERPELPSTSDPYRWVRLQKHCELTGDTPDAVHARRRKRVWRDGVHSRVGPDGNLYVSPEAYNRWVEGQGSQPGQEA